MKQIIILGSPSSRTYWTSKFLAKHQGIPHAVLVKAHTLQDCINYLNRGQSISDEYAAVIMRDILPYLTTDYKLVTIRRDQDDVIQAMIKNKTPADYNSLDRMLTYINRELDFIEANYPVLRMDFDDFNDHIEDLWEWTIEEPFDQERWDAMKDLKLKNPSDEWRYYMDEWLQNVLLKTMVEVLV